MNIILASNSPRRQEIIKKITPDYTVIPSNFDERNVKFNGEPTEYVMELSREKAYEVSNNHESSYVIGMDTIVYIDGSVLNKPNDKNEAREMMKLLSGRMHEVYTGFTIVNKKKNIFINSYELTTVLFDEIEELELESYLDGNDWEGKAGAYGIQGDASKFINNIAGDFFNVVGFPINRIYKELKSIDDFKEDLVKNTIDKPLHMEDLITIADN